MNYFAIGFVGVLGVVGVGIDYQQQSVKAGLPLGQLSASQYFQSYEARFLGAKAEMAAADRERDRVQAWKQGGVQYLPEAPEGWTRRAYNDGINTAIQYDDVVFFEELAKNGGAKTIAENLKAQKFKKKADKINARSYVYEKDGETVLITVNARKRINMNGLMGMMTAIDGAMSTGPGRVRGYGVVGGVGFVEVPSGKRNKPTQMMKQMKGASLQEIKALAENPLKITNRGKKSGDGFRRAHFRKLVGYVGFDEEIRVQVHANASEASTLALLHALDWDGINNMLETPVAVVGNDVVLDERHDLKRLAVQEFALRSQFHGLRKRANLFRLVNVNDAALVMSVYTGGAVNASSAPDLTRLIEGGYRKELRDLFAGRPSSNELARIRSMLEERPESERDTPQGQMSDKLREELSGRDASLSGAAAAMGRKASATAPDQSKSGGFAAAFASMFSGKGGGAQNPPRHLKAQNRSCANWAVAKAAPVAVPVSSAR